ncbi:MAG: c-type cytochrome [Deltaproteobacteria bacterium]|nr:c-type cytochrome [Deltaproteobacteria bacterium]
MFARRVVRDFDVAPPTFELVGRPIGGATAAGATAPHLTAARIFAAGDGAVVIDADSGALIKTDKAGKNIGQLPIGVEAGLMSFDAATKTAFVADRRGDKLLVVNTSTMEVARTIKTPTEPYGVALLPDKKTVLVSTIADRTLVAYDTSTGAEKWRTPLGREPRGLAVSPDGARALVAYLTTGTVDQIDLSTHRSEHIALSNAVPSRRGRRAEGDSFARASFAVTFMGAAQAIVPFQREVPVQQSDGSERTGSYGGGFEPPVTQQLAFLGFGKDTPSQITASISQHQPRAMAWDGARDALYIAGLGSDSILQVRNASQVGIVEGLSASVTSGKDRCGPDGVAVAGDGNVLVWCSFTRTVQRVEFVDGKGAFAAATKLTAGPQVVASRLSEKQHKGLVIFHSADPATSQRGSMACSTCHPDNRADGLSWRIEKHTLQTPILAGRVVGTHPYKWDGGDKTLVDSMTSTMRRLGGFGLDKTQTEALMAYVESLPSVRAPAREATQVARGKALFDSAQLGCRTCHDGATYQDNSRHRFSGNLAEADTPSLLGLAASAPYYHDGSAATLEALLRDRGAVHGMAETSKLTDGQVADLTAFLETL